jgi:outer membrane protein assembly factor BamB
LAGLSEVRGEGGVVAVRVRLWVGAVLAVAALASGGCADPGVSASDPSPAVPVSTPVRHWTADGPPAFSEIVATISTVVYAVVEDGRLIYVGRSVDDGRLLWRSPADPGFHVPGSVLRPIVVDGILYHLDREPDSSDSTVVALDVTTGTTRWRTTLPGVADAITRCGSSGVVVRYRGRTTRQEAVLDLSSGAVRSDEAITDTTRPNPGSGNARARRESRPSIKGTVSLESEPDQAVVWRADGSQAAKVSIEDLVGGPGGAFDHGYGVWFRDGVWLVFTGAEKDDGPGSEGTVTGLDSEGRVLWRRPDRRPCALDDRPPGPLLCAGPLPADTETAWRPDAVERVDPHTGATRWELALDGRWEPEGPTAPIVELDEHRLVLNLADRPVLIDWDGGPVPGPPPAQSVGWCRSGGGLQDLDDAWGGGRYLRAAPYHPCRVDGTPLDQPVGAFVPEAAVLGMAGMWVWIGAGGRVQAASRR